MPPTISTSTACTHLIGSPSRASFPSPSPASSSSSTSHLRILILEPSPKPFCSDIQQPHTTSLIPPLLHVLTGEPPPHLPPTLRGDGGSGGHGDDGTTERQSFAGYTTHPPLAIRTKYFDRRVCIWCDEVPLPHSFSEQGGIQAGKEGPGGVAVRAEPEGGEEEDPTTQIWLKQMLNPEPEAVEVRSVIGAIVLVLPVQDAVEPGVFPTDKSTVLGGPDNHDDDDDEQNAIHQRASHSPLRREYLDIIEAVNTLRSTIADERTAHDDNTASGNGNGNGIADDVAAVILLQGPKPQPKKQDLHPSPAPAPLHDDVDELIEAVENQLLTDRQIWGWDVAFWDGRVAATATSGAEGEAGSGGGSRAESSTEENGRTRTRTTGKRNIHGEMIGIDRLREVLEGVDWTALPPPPPPPGQSSPSPPFSSSSSSSSSSPPFLHHRHHRRHKIADTHHPTSESTSTHTYADALLGRAAYTVGEEGKRERDDDDDDDDDKDGDGDEAAQVEQLQGLLQQAMAIREAGAELPSGLERDRYARRMVGRLMREL